MHHNLMEALITTIGFYLSFIIHSFILPSQTHNLYFFNNTFSVPRNRFLHNDQTTLAPQPIANVKHPPKPNTTHILYRQFIPEPPPPPPWRAETDPKQNGGSTPPTSSSAHVTCTGHAPSRSAPENPTRRSTPQSFFSPSSTLSSPASHGSTTTTATGTGSSKSSATPPTSTTSPPSTAVSHSSSTLIGTPSPSPVTRSPSSMTLGPFSPILLRRPCTIASSDCSLPRLRRSCSRIHSPRHRLRRRSSSRLTQRRGEILDPVTTRLTRLGRAETLTSQLSQLGRRGRRALRRRRRIARASGPRALTATFCMSIRRGMRSVPCGVRVAGGGFMRW